MAGQLIPLPEHAPDPLPPEMTSQQRFRVWLDMLAAGERLLIAGFKAKAGPDGDWQALYREWYEQTEDDRLQQRIRRDAELRARRKQDAP